MLKAERNRTPRSVATRTSARTISACLRCPCESARTISLHCHSHKHASVALARAPAPSGYASASRTISARLRRHSQCQKMSGQRNQPNSNTNNSQTRRPKAEPATVALRRLLWTSPIATRRRIAELPTQPWCSVLLAECVVGCAFRVTTCCTPTRRRKRNPTQPDAKTQPQHR